MINKKGFTLIELLVVVLIIGILAAVALPMYTKTVEKTRSTQGVTMLSAFEKSFQRFILEHGRTSDSFSNQEEFIKALDIELPVGEWNEFNQYFIKNFKLVDGAECSSSWCGLGMHRINGTPEEYDEAYYLLFEINEDGSVTKTCDINDEKYRYVCEMLEAQGFVIP